VQVTERDVGQICREYIDGERLLVAGLNPPLAELRDGAAHHVTVARRDDRLPLLPHCGRLEQSTVEGPHAFDEARVAEAGARDVGWSEVRDRDE
jgi:hypothetical protein